MSHFDSINANLESFQQLHLSYFFDKHTKDDPVDRLCRYIVCLIQLRSVISGNVFNL